MLYLCLHPKIYVMKSIFSLLSFSLLFCTAQAQQLFEANAHTYQIVYGSSNNGKKLPGNNRSIVFTNNEQTLVTNEKNWRGESSFPYEFFVVERNALIQHLYAVTDSGKIISSMDTAAIKNQQIEFLPDTKTILGYTCKKAKTIVNSNTIELWYNTDLNLKGAPTILGQQIGLVLEMVRNGNFTLTAEEIKPMPGVHLQAPLAMAPIAMDLLSYKDEIWKSRFVSIPIFSNQIIHFSDSSIAAPEVMRFAMGTIAVKKIKLPAMGKGKKIFLELSEQSNGDAYDRTGTVFLIAEDKAQSFLQGLQNGATTLPLYENGNGKKYYGVAATKNYSPAIELMRFFTPFGIHQYNHIQLKGKQWQDVVHYRQDISDFAHLLQDKEVYIGVFIGNYDKGGHRINASISLHNDEGAAPQKIVPLFNTLNIMEMAGQDYATMFDREKGLSISFELKEPIKNAQLRYISTGHGGWGNGDEFVPKVNTILLNGKVVFNMAPWRQDCGSYRLYNPASGNFSNGLSSSDYSRSNWCPGTVSYPYYIPLGNLQAGKHHIQIKIPQGKPEGGSFSSWNVSGVIVGE